MTFEVNNPHVPCEYISRFCIISSQGQDLHVPARWKGKSKGLCASSPIQSLQVPNGDARAAAVDAVEDEPFAATAEIPLATRSST